VAQRGRLEGAQAVTRVVDWTRDWFLRRDVVEINVKRLRTTPDGGDLYLG